MKNILLIISLFYSAIAFSQYSVTGKIIDNDTSEPIEFCNVILYQKGKIANTMQSEESGRFCFENLEKGVCEIEIQYLGYITHKVDITIENNLNLGEIALAPNAFMLEGVEVVAKKRQVIYKLDKKIIDAGSSVIAGGGTATDVLSKLPSVRVDIDGNISFRGSSGFIVQVNGKPSMFNAEQALQQIPANQIENIEIITTPSARNQTDGDAGIINIITKQHYGEGFSGALNLTTNTYGSRSMDFTLNKQSGEHRFKVGGIYGQRLRKSDFEQSKVTTVDEITTTSHSKGPRKGEHYSYILQAGWQLAKKQTNYYIDLTGGYEGHKNKGDLRYSETISKPNIDPSYSEYKSIDDFDIHETLFAGSTGFNHKFTKEGHTLKGHFYLKYGGNALETFISDLYDYSGVRQQGHEAKEAEHRWTVDGRLDYIVPYSSSGRLESGYQYYSYSEHGDYNMEYWSPVTQQFDYRDDIYNTFYFQQGIHSLYLLANQRVGKFEFQGGVRGEHAHRVLRSSIAGADRETNKLEFFPSVHMGYNLDETTNFTAAYSYRINRPGIWYMEPYITFRDYYTAEIGNPDIRPEYINSFELAFKKNIDEQTLQAALFHRNRRDKIERLRIPYEAGITLDSMANVGNDYSTGVEFGLNIKTGKLWNFTFNGDLYHYKVKNKLKDLGGRNESSVNYGFMLNNNFQLTKTTTMQLDGTFVGPSIRTQGSQKGFFYADLGVRQQFINGRLSATFAFRNFLNTAKYRSNIDTPDLISHTKISPKFPLMTLNISYVFNNFKQRTHDRGGSDFFEGTNY